MTNWLFFYLYNYFYYNAEIEQGVINNRDYNLFWTYAKTFFISTISLSIQAKKDFSLWISGILGHSWDYLLRYIKYDFNDNLNVEIKKII